MTEAKQNYAFEENLLGADQIEVTNNLGRAIEHLEIVYLDNRLGECVEFDGIADGASGLINTNPDRVITTQQIETTDTFVVGGIVYFVSGGAAAAGKLRAGQVSGGVPIGVCVDFTAGIAVSVRPFTQGGAAGDLKITKYDITASIAAGVALDIPVGAQIIDAMVVGGAVSAAATVTLEQDNGDDIAVLDCAAVGTVDRASSLANTVVGADGVKLTSSAAAVRGEVTIFWR